MQVFFFYRDSDTYIATSYDDPLYNADDPTRLGVGTT